MGMFSVSLSKEKELREKMDSLNIREEEIKESTCVYLKHIPYECVNDA